MICAFDSNNLNIAYTSNARLRMIMIKVFLVHNVFGRLFFYHKQFYKVLVSLTLGWLENFKGKI